MGQFDSIREELDQIHFRYRREFDLPPQPPRSAEGIPCIYCTNRCQVPEGQYGYCGIRQNQKGKFTGAGPNRGNLSWYHDPLPTNCVADWVCPGGTGCGYPEFAYAQGPEYGYKNLAVFFQACSFDCLFCQNWHYRERVYRGPWHSAQELADAVDARTSCICYFGGDPSPQVSYALTASRLALKQKKNRILRICWETNGSVDPKFLRKMIELSLESGGCIKFDLKAWNECVHYALCGVSNRQTLENFAEAARFIPQRPEPPLVVASTLLVPGYVDEQEVASIARFIADIDPNIPYSLLAFYPCFAIHDLPTTSRNHAQRCYQVAKEVGLKRVKIGNLHLLGNAY